MNNRNEMAPKRKASTTRRDTNPKKSRSNDAPDPPLFSEVPPSDNVPSVMPSVDVPSSSNIGQVHLILF